MQTVGAMTQSCARLVVDPTSTTLAAQVLSDITPELSKYEQSSEELRHLADALRQGLRFLVEGQIPVGQAIPYLIAAASSLDGFDGRSLNKEDQQSIKAACFELQSIFPNEGPAKAKIASPDVSVEELIRKR